MSRYKIKIQYDGTNYFGWQIQSQKRTIQGEIEIALAPLNGDKRVVVSGAGRTDAGVHAFGQVAHFDLNIGMSLADMKNAINARLPKDIHVVDIIIVSDEFHARYSAIKRYYQYQCYYGKNLLFRNQAWEVDKIDIEILNKFSNTLIGLHDFLSFSKLNKDLDSTVCNIYQSEWFERENMLIFNICGNRFLHHMVRYLVATMLAGANGKIDLKNFKELLINPKSNVKIFKAPPQGLILMGIDYE